MEDLLFSLNVVLPLFLIIALGYLLKCVKIADDTFIKKCNSLCFRVLLPFMLFYNIYNNDIGDVFDPKLMTYTFVALIAVVLVACLIVPRLVKDKAKVGVIIQAVFRSNYLLFGIPLTNLIIGSEGVGTASMLAAVVVPLFNVIAVIILAVYNPESGKLNARQIIKNVVTNPLIIAAVIAFPLSAINFRFPAFFETAFTDVAKIATPLSLIMLGGQFNIKSTWNNKRYIFMGTLGRLVITPLLILVPAVMLGFRGASLVTLFAMSASPIALSSYSMAVESGCDGDLAGEIVVVSTCASVITIFAFVYIFRLLGLF